METMTLYTNPYSRGRITRWMLEEIGEPYSVEIMDYDLGIKSPGYLAINPMGKVPALVHGDTVITENVAICAYLADHFPSKQLAPAPTSKERGTYYRWLFFAAGPLEMAMTAKTNDWKIDDKIAPSIGCGRIKDVVTTLEKALTGNEYICGNKFTAADLVLGSYMGWELMQKQLEPLPVFTDYVARVQNREAAKRADKLDNELVQPA